MNTDLKEVKNFLILNGVPPESISISPVFMNEIYEQYIKNKPARATIQAAALPKNALVEIDVIAEVK